MGEDIQKILQVKKTLKVSSGSKVNHRVVGNRWIVNGESSGDAHSALALVLK